MLIVFLLILVFMSMATFLHALNVFFFLDGIAENFHQIDCLHILILSRFQSILDPLVGLATHVDQKVAA